MAYCELEEGQHGAIDAELAQAVRDERHRVLHRRRRSNDLQHLCGAHRVCVLMVRASSAGATAGLSTASRRLCREAGKGCAQGLTQAEHVREDEMIRM